MERRYLIKKKKWGKGTVETLAKDLQVEFQGIQGFSVSNLWRMKGFYASYCKDRKIAQLVREIGWGHNILIIEKCKKPLERLYYIKTSIREGWSRSILQSAIESQDFEKSEQTSRCFRHKFQELSIK